MLKNKNIENYLINIKNKLHYHELVHRIPVFNLFKHVSSIAALCNSIFILVNIVSNNEDTRVIFSIIIAIFNIIILFSSIMYNIFYDTKLNILQERTIERCSNLRKKIEFFIETHDNYSKEDEEKKVKNIFYLYQDILQTQPQLSKKQIKKFNKKLSLNIEEALRNIDKNLNLIKDNDTEHIDINENDINENDINENDINENNINDSNV
jgi:hypothetical protein